MRAHINCAIALMLVLTRLVSAGDAARKMRRMEGFTIVSIATVQEVRDAKERDKKLILLDNKVLLEVDFLLLDPLPMSDVVLFAKPLPDELRARFKGKVPDESLYEYRLLVDNEIYEVKPLRIQ